jgi:acyl-CoA reductase-like NAD-dependent aldehyde dehydrogenase
METARRAQRGWAQVPVQERAALVAGAADRLLEREEDIAELLTEENGKLRLEAVAHEIGPMVAQLRWLEDEAAGILDPESVSLRTLPNRHASIRRRAFGVVLVISPWNIPLAIPMSQVAAALVAGNAVVLKPSEVTPRCGALVAELFQGLPAGLLQVVQGDGKVGAELIAARPDKVLFTGSVATGRKVMAACAAHPIPVGLELGGVDALIVCEDADLEYASSAACWGATFNGGQVCASVERLLVHRSVADRFRLMLVDKLDRIDPERELGRVTAQKQRAVYESHVADARARGLQVHGGDWSDVRRFQPTLVHGEGLLDSDVWKQESFGPLVAMHLFDDDEEAVRLHDDTPFGLTASVFSRDIERARSLGLRLKAGLVSINDVGATLYGHPELPWGGVGESGFGRSHGREGLLELTWPQVLEESRVHGFEPKRPWWYPYDHQQLELMRLFGQLVGHGPVRHKARLLARMGRRAASMVSHAPRL